MSYDCSICLDSITEETGRVDMSCKHKFHLSCISKWLAKNESCPMCRKKPGEKESMANEMPNNTSSTVTVTTVTSETITSGTTTSETTNSETMHNLNNRISQADIDLVSLHLGVSNTEARNSLIRHNGNISLAIIELSDITPFH